MTMCKVTLKHPVKKLAQLTTQTSSLRCVSAEEHHTSKQYSKRAGTFLGDASLLLRRTFLEDDSTNAPTHEGGVKASQLDLPSLTPLFVAGCGRRQPGVTHWDTSVALLQVVDN